MKFNLQKRDELLRAKDYFEKLERKGTIVEIKQIFNNRSYNQNRYIHLLLQLLAFEYGESLFYFKQIIWKQVIAPQIFRTEYTNTKTGEIREDWKSSSDLTTKEMSIATNALIDFAAKVMSIELPLPEDYDKLRLMENELELNQYL